MESPRDDDSEMRKARLLTRWQDAADSQALDELLRLELEPLKRSLRASHRGATAASDIAQGAVVNLLRRQGQPHFASPASFRGYLWRTARNLMIDHVRRSKRTFHVLSHESSQSLCSEPATSGCLSEVERDDMRAALELAINLLSPEDQTALRAKYVEQLSPAELANRLGTTVDAARMRLARARTQLAARLTSWNAFLSAG